MLSVSVLVSFTGTLTQAAGGERMYMGVMGKPDRMFVISIISIGALFSIPHIWNIGFSAIIVGGLITIVLRIQSSYKELQNVTNN